MDKKSLVNFYYGNVRWIDERLCHVGDTDAC